MTLSFPAAQPSGPQRRGKLTAEQVRDVFLSTDSTRLCGQRHGITAAAVSMIRTRRTWRHLTRNLTAPPRPDPPVRHDIPGLD